MSKTIIAIIIIIIVVGLGYWIYQSTLAPKGLTEKEQACIDSGGTVSTSLCCKNTTDFPNLCLIGPCGCSPDNSHQVKVCDCGPDKCFNGSECLSLDEVSNLLEGLEEISWVEAEQLVANCQVERVGQTHARAVTIVLKNGDRLKTTEPNLDDIINIARAAEEKCGEIEIATE